MTQFTYSAVLIIPSYLQDKANKVSCALGHDILPGNTYVAPLSTDGLEPVTHYGCRAVATQDFVDTLASAALGTLPPVAWADFGLTEVDVQEVLGTVLYDFRPATQSDGHYTTAAASYGLQEVILQEV